MKQLTIAEPHEIDIGPYGPACEGFIDALKSFFTKKDPIKNRVEIIKNDKYMTFRVLETTLEKDLKLTYDNPAWVRKTLEGNSGFSNIAALVHANSEGKLLKTPEELVKIAKSMLEVVKEVARREQPFIEFRSKLIKQIQKERNPAIVDRVWLENEKKLSITAVDRQRQYDKKSHPAFGSDRQKHPWPVDFKPTTRECFNHAWIKTSGEFVVPTPQNAKNFADAIRSIFDILLELTKIGGDTYVSYWDILEVEYDALSDGDAVFSYLCSGQDGWEVSDLAFDTKWTLCHIVCGLYIAMFDKVIKK